MFQACRGEKLDPGVTLISRKGSVSETDAGNAAYKIPSYSDFLISYSSMHGNVEMWQATFLYIYTGVLP